MRHRPTKRNRLFALHAEGISKREAFALLRPKVIAQEIPWIFSANVKGQGRVTKSISAQLVDLQHEISRVWNLLEKQDNPIPADYFDSEEIPETEDSEEIEEEKADPSEEETPNEETEKRFFFREWKRVAIDWMTAKYLNHGHTPIDSLDSLRPTQAAKRMIEEGITAKACLHAMALHWPTHVREDAGIAEVDFLAESPDMGAGFHKMAGYVRKLMLAAKGQGFGVMLIGPAGSAKSYTVRKLAESIKTESHPNGLPYGETPMTPGATRGDLLGRHTLDGFVTSQFVEIYSGGGVFNFEEIDASDPAMLIVVNNALASGQLFNSSNGQVYDKHCDFIATCTGNTFGMGADSKYTAREKLDLATIDRFRMARVILGLDVELAESLMFAEG